MNSAKKHQIIDALEQEISRIRALADGLGVWNDGLNHGREMGIQFALSLIDDTEIVWEGDLVLDPAYHYWISLNGQIYRTLPSEEIGTYNPTELVASTGITQEPGYHYFITKSGAVAREPTE